MRACLPLILSAGIAGCGSVDVHKGERLPAGATFVALSMMGDSFALRESRASALRDGSRRIDVADWRVDRHTETVAQRIVAGNGMFRVAPADTDELRKAVRLEPDHWTGDTKIHANAASVAAFAKQSGADYLLLIGPASVADAFLGTGQQLSGYGVYQAFVAPARSYASGVVKRVMNYVTMRVTLLDAVRAKPVADRKCAIAATPERTDWLDAAKSIRTDQGMRAEMQKLVEGALRKCLAGLGMP